MKLAKIDRICLISGNVEYSILDESAYSCGRRQIEHRILRNVSPDEVGDRIKASLVSEEDFQEFLSLFQEEDDERIARLERENEKREEEKFYASLSKFGQQYIQEHPECAKKTWKEVRNAIDEAFRSRYHTGGGRFEGSSHDFGNGWQPLGG